MRYNQPQSGPLQIDWGNPITRGMFVVIDGVSGRDILAGAPSTDLMARSAGTVGIGRNFTTAAYATFPFKRARITDKFSYFVLMDLDAFFSPGNSFIFGDVEAASTGYNAGLYSNGANFQFYVKTGGSSTNVSSTTASNLNHKRLRLAGTYDGATMRQYVNGVQEGSAAKTGNIDAGAFSLNINRWNAASGHTGRHYLELVWNRDLSAAENASLAANPWQIFASAPRIIWAPAAGGAATYSYTASGGFVLSGTAPTVRGIIRTATGGATFSGSAAQSRGMVKSASGGILFAGAASQVRRRAVTPAGGLTLSGAATIRRAIVRSAAGGLNLAGAASVTFFSAVQTRIVTPVGGLLVSGAAAIVRGIRRLATGGFTLAGHAPVTTSDSDPIPGYGVNTVIRASIANVTVASIVDAYGIDAGTMHDSNSTSATLRASPINLAGTLRADPVNLTVVFP